MTLRFATLAGGAVVLAGVIQQPPAFRSGVDAVRVDVQVTRGGQAVPGLGAADFELKDSGVVQRIEAFSLEQQPIDVLLALDTSASMRGDPLDRLKEAAHAAIAVLDGADRIALLTFAHDVSLRQNWTADRRAAGAAIDGLTAAGDTSLEDAAYAGFTLRERARGRMLELIFSDGFDTASWLDPVRVLDQARKSDLVVDAVLLGAPPPEIGRRWFRGAPVPFREQFLPVLVEETGGDLLSADRTDLKDAFVRIVRLFKMRYVISYVPENVPAGGWHAISVRLTRIKADARARSGYER